MPSSPDSSPGYTCPQSLIYAAGLALGLWMSAWMPSRWLPAAVCRAAGWTLIAAALALVLPAFFGFFRARTTVRPDRPASSLVTSGPYRFTRNPMYVSHGPALRGRGYALPVCLGMAVAPDCADLHRSTGYLFRGGIPGAPFRCGLRAVLRQGPPLDLRPSSTAAHQRAPDVTCIGWATVHPLPAMAASAGRSSTWAWLSPPWRRCCWSCRSRASSRWSSTTTSPSWRSPSPCSAWARAACFPTWWPSWNGTCFSKLGALSAPSTPASCSFRSFVSLSSREEARLLEPRR